MHGLLCLMMLYIGHYKDHMVNLEFHLHEQTSQATIP